MFREFYVQWKNVSAGAENGGVAAMNVMKWAWVLFVAASLAVLIRLAMWLMPAPGWRAEKVEAAAEAAPAEAPAEPVAAAPEPPPAPPTEPTWPVEAEERTDWLPPAPVPPVVAEPPAPPPEEFHFRRTRWGMGLDEVRLSEAGAPLRESENGLRYATTTLELPCLLTYSFVQDRLVRARLSFSDPAGRDLPPLTMAQAQRRFLYLREQLRNRYGEPVQKTVPMPRDVSDLRRSALKQDELARQYDAEIAEAEQRLKKQRERLDARFARWPNRAEMVTRDLAPYERDLRELRAWKQEALERGAKSRQSIQQKQDADRSRPLVATLSARWPFARELHDIELKLDGRSAAPQLDIRYEAAQGLPDVWQMNEL
jgi:hypothetical protein